jgi:hypothetical protein
MADEAQRAKVLRFECEDRRTTQWLPMVDMRLLA